MKRHGLQDLEEGKAIHAVSQEHRISRIVLPLGAFFVVFLMLAVMINFAIFIKTVTIASIIVYIYFAISLALNVHDKVKRKGKLK